MPHLSDDQVRQVFARLARGEKAVAIAGDVGVSADVLSKIARRTLYRAVAIPVDHLAAVASSRRIIKTDPNRKPASAKLTPLQVEEIRRRYPAELRSKLAREFGVTRETILKVTSGLTWVDAKRRKIRQLRAWKLSPEKAAEIRRRASAGEHHANIARDFGIRADYVSAVVAGHRWNPKT